MTAFGSIKEGARVWNVRDGVMTARQADFFGDGVRVLCFDDGRGGLWLASQFDAREWHEVREACTFCEFLPQED